MHSTRSAALRFGPPDQPAPEDAMQSGKRLRIEAIMHPLGAQANQPDPATPHPPNATSFSALTPPPHAAGQFSGQGPHPTAPTAATGGGPALSGPPWVPIEPSLAHLLANSTPTPAQQHGQQLPPGPGSTATASPAGGRRTVGAAGLAPSPSPSPSPSPRQAGAVGGCNCAPPSPRDGRGSQLSPEQKVQRILERHGQSFCEELQIPMQEGRLKEGLWQWLCASILFSARIKSNAAVSACKALFEQQLCTPEAVRRMTKEDCRRLLHDNGYERYDEKTASFLVDDARAVLAEYGGDLSRLRDGASCNPGQERALLKKLKGVGDGGVDIFFREVQLVWHELFPFADKKALKAARLVGLREHPQSLAELCGQDKVKYVRLVAALVRIELSKTYNEF